MPKKILFRAMAITLVLLISAAAWAQAGGASQREVIATDKAPKASGPYSQAIRANGFVFCAGQLPIDPASNQVVQGDVKAQAEQVLKNLSAVLSEAGASFDTVVKTTIFVKSMNDFGAVNEVYGKVFTKDPPARATVEVARLPKDVLVEIEAIALAGTAAGKPAARKR